MATARQSRLECFYFTMQFLLFFKAGSLSQTLFAFTRHFNQTAFKFLMLDPFALPARQTGEALSHSRRDQLAVSREIASNCEARCSASRDLWELLLLNCAAQGSKIIVSFFRAGLQQRAARVKQMPVKAGAKRCVVRQRRRNVVASG